MENRIITPGNYGLNTEATGHVKIWKIKPETNYKELIFNEKNIITYQGADIMADALSGKANSTVTHFYIAYKAGTPSPSAAALTDTCASFSSTAPDGYLRLPLAFSASYLAETNYTNNVPYFTTFITSGSGSLDVGEPFVNGVKIFSLGLVNAQDPNNSDNDRLFSRIVLSPVITYDSSYGLAITWGITFRAVTPS